MEPIAESLEALTRLSNDEVNLVENLRDTASRVVQTVPECVAISVAHFDRDLTFTLVATSDAFRVLDAAQYLDGGPCETAAVDGDEIHVGDVLNEDRWQLFALASAIQGVRSSLSLPMRRGDTVYGSVNFYANTRHAFIGREHDLAVMFGAKMEEAVANADLSMASLGRAREAVDTLDENDRINEAIGMLAERHHMPIDEARASLLDAANRAGITAIALAELVRRRRLT